MVTENLIAIAISVVKSKSAAFHFETMIAAHAFTGSDVGDFGHSRKNFPAILKAANVWLNRQTRKFFCKPLPSTGVTPSFLRYLRQVNTEKDNQPSYCFVSNGRRQARSYYR